ncbi:hypothetical protein HJG60_008396 [Phyllostomus discolor]|uniref:Uncharacterized protein n=1 Tax=Phyllostomus discolor TaxID=89673 RepID=A0A833Z1H5_9CHIR|nr:hypothetical protein HJG60_008396 [Phyllostomus discolor]
MLGPLSLKAFLANQVSQEFMHSFLGLITLGNHPFQHRAAPTSSIVSGLSQVGYEGSQEIRRLLTDRMRIQVMSKPRGEGLSPPFSLAPPKSFRDGPIMTVPVLGHPSLEESYPSLANQSST